MQMSVTHRQALTVTAGTAVSVDESFDCTGENNISESIGAGQTNKLVNFACDVSTLVSLFIKVSAACVIKTNDSGTPDDTFTFLEAGWIVWNNLMPAEVACPLTADVTALYVTNTPAVTVEIKSGVDATP